MRDVSVSERGESWVCSGKSIGIIKAVACMDLRGKYGWRGREKCKREESCSLVVKWEVAAEEMPRNLGYISYPSSLRSLK